MEKLREKGWRALALGVWLLAGGVTALWGREATAFTPVLDQPTMTDLGPHGRWQWVLRRAGPGGLSGRVLLAREENEGWRQLLQAPANPLGFCQQETPACQATGIHLVAVPAHQGPLLLVVTQGGFSGLELVAYDPLAGERPLFRRVGSTTMQWSVVNGRLRVAYDPPRWDPRCVEQGEGCQRLEEAWWPADPAKTPSPPAEAP